jgi:two-component system sensor histidine kinase ChvG
MPSKLRDLSRSLALKFIVLLVIFLAVPLILYEQFRAVDEEKNLLLLRSMQEEGRLIAIGMSPLLAKFQASSANALKYTLAKMALGRGNVKLLFRPKDTPDAGTFFYIGAAPPAPADYLNQEMAEMVKTGILEILRNTCEGDRPLSTHYKNPAGDEEILTSITPVNLENGCWAVITSNSKEEFVNSSFAQPYWKTAEVRFAAAIYVLMAVVVIVLFVGVWRSLNRFESLARKIRTDGSSEASFAADNRIPELAGVALEFDRLVNTLHTSARSIRQAAEENAHALKAPLAVIAQSLEPLKRAVGQEAGRPRRSLELIERSVNRLDALVSAARRMDEAAAELIDAPHRRIDFSALLGEALAAFAEWPLARGLALTQKIEPRVTVWGGEDMIETVIENILENAISFSPPGAVVAVTLRRNGGFAEFVVEDEGPGVAAGNLERIFERYFSERPAGPEGEEDHFGIGLWIVRRNVEAMGGTVTASIRGSGGLKVTVDLRLAA